MAKTDLNPSPLALDSWFLSLTQASPKPQDKKGVGEGQATKVRRMTAASGLEMASHRRNFCSLNLSFYLCKMGSCNSCHEFRPPEVMPQNCFVKWVT